MRIPEPGTFASLGHPLGESLGSLVDLPVGLSCDEDVELAYVSLGLVFVLVGIPVWVVGERVVVEIGCP